MTKRTTNVDLKLFSVEACDQSYRAGDLLELTLSVSVGVEEASSLMDQYPLCLDLS